MSYIDGVNVPGSRSPYTVWLRSCFGGVVGIDFRTLNKYIKEYNRKKYKQVFSFWAWLSYQEFGSAEYVEGFSALWNDHNINMNKVIPIDC